jgi:hypothetical protein
MNNNPKDLKSHIKTLMQSKYRRQWSFLLTTQTTTLNLF